MSTSTSSSVSSVLSSFHHAISAVPSLSLLPPTRPFYFLSASNSLKDALQLLSARGILSAPVFDVTHEVCLGACSLLTIATFLAKEHARRTSAGGKGNGKDVSLEAATLFLEEATKSLGEVQLAEVMKSENARASLATFYEENPLSLLIDYFQTRAVHRVALISKSCELTHPCSQSDVITWLGKQFSEKKFAHLGALSIQQIISYVGESKVSASTASSLHSSKPICVPEPTPVVAALDLMSQENISCVGVLNSTGQLVAGFSSSDLRGLSDCQYLSLPVLDYLKKFSSSSLEPLLIKSSTTFASFLLSLHSKRIHRGWLVDESHCPLRVITLSDIMKFLSSGSQVTEEAANAGKDVNKLWTAKLLDAGKSVDSSHLFRPMNELSDSAADGTSDGKADTGK